MIEVIPGTVPQNTADAVLFRRMLVDSNVEAGLRNTFGEGPVAAAQEKALAWLIERTTPDGAQPYTRPGTGETATIDNLDELTPLDVTITNDYELVMTEPPLTQKRARPFRWRQRRVVQAALEQVANSDANISLDARDYLARQKQEQSTRRPVAKLALVTALGLLKHF